MGTLRVVGVQDLDHDLEEVGQTSIPESVSNGNLPIPLAEGAIHDVRMDHTVPAGSRVRIDGFHGEGMGFPNLAQIESDHERPQVQLV